jgi:orotate phosphoribosyltransferase
MIWIPVSGALAALALMLIATVLVIAAALRTKRHAEALVPVVLIAKFEKAHGDVGRIEGAVILTEALVIRAREALERIRSRLSHLG